MSKEQLIRRLERLRKPVIAGYGCFDTGIEFRVMTRDGGRLCHGGGTWPIVGPAKFNATQFKAAEALRACGFEPGQDDLDEFFEECETAPSGRQRAAVEDLSEEALKLLFDMAGQGCKPGMSYFIFRDECSQENSYFRSYREAEEYFISAVSDSVKSWKRMTEEELSEWVELLESQELEPFCGREEVIPAY